jgi:demethylmenaquinone methyltransferase/2-methoxy-6-polyprenyl-1,4-benzoquinol methylase
MEHYPPTGQSDGKREQVERMFDAIARRYDLLNRVLSAGIDQYWRKAAVSMLGEGKDLGRVLDLATGTADLAFAACRAGASHVTGIDISSEMLEVGRRKIRDAGLEDRVDLVQGDAQNLSFDDGRFDAAMVAFGVRNFENVVSGLAEIRRVLRPGGRLVVLEFSTPRRFPIKQAYSFYSARVLPRIGAAISGDAGAYRYLPDSVREFPDGEDFLALLSQAGFTDLAERRMTFGIASLYLGVVPTA